MECVIMEFSKESTIVNRKLRFHLLGLAHLPTSKLYNSCAFTQKNIKLSKMLTSLGHEVFLYGCKSYSENYTLPVCTEFIPTHTVEDIRDDYGEGDNRFEIGYDWMKNEFRHDINSKPNKSTLRYIESCIREISKRKRNGDILLITQGVYQKAIGDVVNIELTCEPGIGYRGSYCKYRAFESAYIQNFTYGSEHPRQSINGNYYDRVIPNYFDEDDILFSEEKFNYFLYIGRMISRKGVDTAVKVCNIIGKDLLLAGQGADIINGNLIAPGELNIKPGKWIYAGYADYERRKRLFANACGVFVPTLYLEPFAGTHIEAMLSGTPVITTDFGVFPETVINGVNGFRCNVLQDFINAANKIKTLSPVQVRNSAEKFLCNNVKWLYEKWFQELYDLYESVHNSSKLAWHRIRNTSE
jgi:glycosyltransferase involved in cell wall biosynthesis